MFVLLLQDGQKYSIDLLLGTAGAFPTKVTANFLFI